MRRRALSNILGTSLFAVLAITAVAACTARAEDYPTRPIKIVSPHPVGVATDILGRALALKLNESLGQPVIVENRPGANGMIAAGQIAKASPDGYTLHITTGAHIANAFVAKDLPYDVIKDFAPVTQLAASYGLALITNLPVKSVAELVELAKQEATVLRHERHRQYHSRRGPAVRRTNRHQDGRRALQHAAIDHGRHDRNSRSDVLLGGSCRAAGKRRTD